MSQRREFQFTEGSSNKFWSIELKDTSFIVHFGRVGTAGQAQEKSFASAEAAKKEHDKLIGEKTRKGYAEVAASGAGPVTVTPRPAPVKKAAEEKPALAPGNEPDASPAAPEKPAVPAAALTLERRVHIDPAVRNRISWLWQPQPAPTPRPFDYEACVKAAVKWCTSYGYVYTHAVTLPPRLTREEAWFWLCARHASVDKSRKNWLGDWENRRVDSPAKWEILLRANTANAAPPDNPGEDEIVSDAISVAAHHSDWLPALQPFFSSTDLAERLIDADLRSSAGGRSFRRDLEFSAAPQFHALILNYTSAEERARFREVMAARFNRETDLHSDAAQLALSYLAPVRGGAELDRAIASIPPGVSGNQQTICLNLFTLAGLADEASFVREARRLKVAIPPPNGYSTDAAIAYALIWLAATEWRELDWIVNALVDNTPKDDTAKLARVLAKVEAPETAAAMLEVQLRSKAPYVAAEWFAQYPLHTAVGLTPVAMASGKSAEAAREHLHTLRRSGQTAVLEAALAHLPEHAAAWLRREIIDHAEESLADAARDELPAELAAALSALKPLKAPAWLQVVRLPPIKLAGKKLPAADVERVLSAVKDTPLAGAAAAEGALPILKRHADPMSLDAFAWSLFEQWLGMGAPSKEKWALGAIGHLGADGCVLKLTPLIRDWPGESQHQRAVYGLEVLRAVGSDTALMALNGIAQKLKFQGLKEKAKTMMEGIAEARGFTREQLADRIVPDCGLDEKGGRVFDFGPRQFSFVLGPEMKPLVRDATGKVKSDLSAPNKSDDADKAEAAVAEWKLLKKTLKEALKVQASRLEEAMITGRRWTAEEFDQLVVKHPLMINLARQLVFGAYDEKGALLGTFRVTEDQSLADCRDDACELPATATGVGVIHPAHLDAETKSAWGQILSDYEIIPPFQQLGREICHPEPADLDKTEITRFKGPKIPGIVVYGILERSLWVKDTPADAGGFMQHSKYFPSAEVTAFIAYDPGLSIGYYDEPQQIASVYFVPGHVKPDWWGNHKNKLAIRDVDRVVLSEVLRLVHAIVSKAE
ncbi:MAG: DUF4132 domain-containing protein [Verrucomicrobiales bacterium]|nr:DUF4132 domain-containing protein [Verrucomicrobiales bacterium]